MESKQATLCHRGDLDLSPQTPFAEMLELARVRDPVSFFDHRADRTTIANWKAGRHPPPAWAVDRLRLRWQELETHGRAILQRIPKGPGRKAGTRNIMAWRARR